MAYKPFDVETLIDAAASMLHLKLEPEYRDGVKNHLKTAAKMAALVEQVKIEGETEPAPVYRA